MTLHSGCFTLSIQRSQEGVFPDLPSGVRNGRKPDEKEEEKRISHEAYELHCGI